MNKKLILLSTVSFFFLGRAAELPQGSESGAPQATVTIDAAAPTVKYSPMIFGGFLEHFDHQIYGGIYDPGSPLSDPNRVVPESTTFTFTEGVVKLPPHSVSILKITRPAASR